MNAKRNKSPKLAKAKREYGNIVRFFREQQELSQLELCAECGINQSVLSKIESGYAVPSIIAWEDLCAALGLQLDVNISPEQWKGFLARRNERLSKNKKKSRKKANKPNREARSTTTKQVF